MKSFDDIRYKSRKKTPIVIDESYDPARARKKSPYVIDLKGRPRLRHRQPSKLTDVVVELNEDLKNRRRIYEEKFDPPRKTAGRFREAIRMAAVATAVVFTLNTVNVFYTVLDLKDEVATAATSSYTEIMEGGLTQDAFESAEGYFEDAQRSLWFLQNQRQELLQQNKTASAVSGLLDAGEELSRAGTSFVAFVDNVRSISENLLSEKTDPNQPSLTEQLKATYDFDFVNAVNELRSANDKIQSANVALFPADIQNSVIEAKTQLGDLVDVLDKFESVWPVVLRLLGDRYPQRYLVLLENNHEGRPGGGFIGSYMIVDINDGYLDGMTFHDVYEIDGQYQQAIAPPGEIADLTTNWRFRDSNYSPDLSVSSAKGAWFLEEEGGPGVDHVLTIDLEFVSRLLTLTGPIQLDSLPNPLNADNFSTILSYMVESKLTGEESPKTVLGELVGEVQVRLREQKPWLDVIQLFQEMASGKHFSAYSKTHDVQTFFDDFGVSGVLPVPAPREDYFMLIHTSIGGNKTDRYMERAIDHRTFIQEDGILLDQVTVTQRHLWTDEEEARVTALLNSFGFTEIEGWVMDILGRAPNTSALRFYVPHGSRILSAGGVDLADITLEFDEDLQLDYFYLLSTVYPGDEDIISLTYQLPYTLDFAPLDEYRLNVFKQAGDTRTTLTKSFIADSFLTHYRSFPEEITEDPDQYGIYTYETDLTRDLHVAQLWGKP